MKAVRLLAIEHQQVLPAEAGSSSDYDVRVLVDVEGQQSWHKIRVQPRIIGGYDANLLVASQELLDLFRDQQTTVHRICKLVGEELRGAAVRVPQQIAA